MILDHENMFSYRQAVTGAGFSTNIVDLGPGDAGPSERLSLFVAADTPFTSSSDLMITLHAGDAIRVDGTITGPNPIAIFQIRSAALTAGGKLMAARLPHGCKRYLVIEYHTTGTLAGGTITAGLVWDVQADMPDPVTATAQGL